jgi:hypothetical protein
MILFDFFGENMVSKKIKQNHKITASHLTRVDLYSNGVIESLVHLEGRWITDETTRQSRLHHGC